MVNIESGNVTTGIFVDNKYLVTSIKGASSYKYISEFIGINADTEWNKYVNSGSRSGTLSIGSSSDAEEEYSATGVLHGYFTTRYQCNSVNARIQIEQKDAGFHEQVRIILHGDTSDYTKLENDLKNFNIPNSDWYIFLNVDRFAGEVRFNIRTKNTNIFNSEEFGYKKISVPPYQDIEVEVEMSIHRLDNSYYCVLSVQMYAGSTTKIYSGSVLVCNASEFLMRPILSGNITNDSTSDPNNITVYLGPAINKSYRSLSNK